jgi:hypothetical protein
VQMAPVGWVERSDTHHSEAGYWWVSLRSTHPTISTHTGNAMEYFTWLNAKLDSIEAMPSSRVSLFFKNAS